MKRLLTIVIILACLFCITTKASANEKEFYTPFDYNTSVNIYYPSPICSSSSPVSVTMSGTGNYLDGLFSATTGLFINAVTGEIVPASSVPGTYVITYSLPAGPDNPAIETTFVVTIVPEVVPVFDAVAPICYGNSSPVLPSVSNNGIHGTWNPSTVSNTTSGTYTFTPSFGQCAVSTNSTINVDQTVAIITSNNGSNTVYVDGNNANVVLPLVLFCDTATGNYSYQWYLDGVLIVNATSYAYSVNTATLNGEDRVFTVQATNVVTGCSGISTPFVVFQSTGVPLPSGQSEQTVPSGSTLADLVVIGTDIQWYDSANRNATLVALPLNTLLVDNTTYYATQTVNGNESLERLPVRVHLTLATGENELVSLIYFPNPAKNHLTITNQQDIEISTLRIYNSFGQLVQVNNNPNETIDVSGLSSGSYYIKIISDKGNATGKFIKE